MGAFVVNFHVRTDSRDKVGAALRKISDAAWLAGPNGNWVSFWDAQASQQNSDRICYLAEHVSRSLDAPVIAFLVHDSDIFCYWLYDQGRRLDEYNSCPGYWGEEELDEAAVAGDLALLARYCRPDVDTSQLEQILDQATQTKLASGAGPAFVFAEERLMRLAPLMGLRNDVVMVDFKDIGSEVGSGELGARWIGRGKQPKSNDSGTDAYAEALRARPSSPLHEAVAQDDLDAIERLVAAGADIDEIPHGYNVTALAMAGSPATIRKMVALGANLQTKVRDGLTPLRLAVQFRQVDRIRTLVELGADIQEFDDRIGTLLHVAIALLAPDMVHLLLELGVDSNRTNAAGVTPLAAVHAQRESLRVLGAMLPAIMGDRMRAPLDEIEQILTDSAQQSP